MNAAAAELIDVAGGRLAYRCWRARRTAATPLVLLHGFTGSSQSWELLAERWTLDRDVFAFDLPGHGHSDLGSLQAACDMAGFYAAFDEALDALRIDRYDLLGYSLGGRTALFVATRPAGAALRLRRLVLESASPGLATVTEREARQRVDGELIEMLRDADIAAFIDRWERTPVLAAQRRLPEPVQHRQRRLRLECSAPGLAASLTGMGTGAQPWLGDALRNLRQPTLCMAGEHDGKFAALARTLARSIPNGKVAILPDCGHSPHLEDPDTYFEIVDRFLRVGGRRFSVRNAS